MKSRNSERKAITEDEGKRVKKKLNKNKKKTTLMLLRAVFACDALFSCACAAISNAFGSFSSSDVRNVS